MRQQDKKATPKGGAKAEVTGPSELDRSVRRAGRQARKNFLHVDWIKKSGI
jgi:hypothetical protein